MAFLHTFLALAVAFVLGTGIGFELQWRQRNAGLRTNVLVAVGAAAFSDLGLRLTGTEGAVRIIALRRLRNRFPRRGGHHEGRHEH